MSHAGEAVKEAGELLKIALKDDKDGKRGDASKQLQAALAYVGVQRLFAQVLRGSCVACIAVPLTRRCHRLKSRATCRRYKPGAAREKGRGEETGRCLQEAQGLA